MNEKIKTLSEQVFDDIQILRESGDYAVEKRLGVEIMALNALTNAIKVSAIRSTRTRNGESLSCYMEERM